MHVQDDCHVERTVETKVPLWQRKKIDDRTSHNIVLQKMRILSVIACAFENCRLHEEIRRSISGIVKMMVNSFTS
jgi:hypothetical protein